MLNLNTRKSVYAFEPLSAGCLIVIIFVAFVIVISAIISSLTNKLAFDIELSDQYVQRSGPKQIVGKVEGCQSRKIQYSLGMSEEISFTYKRSDALPLPKQMIEEIVGKIYTQLSKEEKSSMGQNRGLMQEITIDCAHETACWTNEKLRVGKLHFTDDKGNREEAGINIPVEVRTECKALN